MDQILRKFNRMRKRGKPLYIESYKIMAASTEVIKMRGAEVSATTYFVCLQDMMNNAT